MSPAPPPFLPGPLVAEPERAPAAGAWTQIFARGIDLARAIAAGAGAVLVPCRDDFDDLGRTDAALAVAEAEAGLDDGRLPLFALVAGAGATAALPWRTPPSRRLRAIGLWPDGLAAAPARPLDDPVVLTAAGLVGLTARAHGLAAFLAVPAAAPAPPWPGFVPLVWPA